MGIQNYALRVERAKVRLADFKDEEVALAFLNYLKVRGLTDARICFYASRIKIVLQWFQTHDIFLKNATKKI